MSKKKLSKTGMLKETEAFMKSLFRRMEAQGTADELNDNVIIPFTAALEEVCAARGYVLNIFGKKSNFVFTGSEKDAEAIYKLIETYLEARG